MKDFLILKILDRFKFLFNKLNIDYPVFRKILQVKLIMDGRRVPTMLGNTRKRETQNKNYFLSSLWFYSLFGFMMIVPFVFIINNMLAQMSIIFAMLLFLQTSTVIADFSSVVLDIRDKTIISSKPVDSKTLTVAKFFHIFHFLFLLTLALTGPGIIAIFLKYLVLEGFIYSLLFTFLFIGEIILLNLFIIVLTTLIYLIILKIYSGEKLKDIINYVQILMVITITVGYQLLARMFQTNIQITEKWYTYFIVPVWFGAPFEIFFQDNKSIFVLVLSVLALLIPIIAFVIYLKLIPTFEDSLLKLNEVKDVEKYRDKKWHVYKLFIRDKEERSFYKFSTEMMKSERDFKLKVYPSLGFSIIFPFIFLFQVGFNINHIWDILFYFEGTKLHLYIYFCAFMLPSAVMMLKFSKYYKGSWIYKVSPVKNFSAINKGVLKAFIMRLLLPIYLVECFIFILLFNITIIPDLIVVFITMLIFVVICFKILGHSLPFSEPFENANKSQGMVVILLMVIIGFFALIHFLFTLFNIGIYIYLVILLFINAFTWKQSF